MRIPRDQLVVITGLSGSGKSSLAFDTIYAEGQRRYVESLSAYARQFLEQMSQPDVDSIDGLSPAISIEQRSVAKNPRSTVGTITEIHDHLRLLYARVGQPHCWICGDPIASQTVQQMTDRVLSLAARSEPQASGEAHQAPRVQVLAPVIRGRKGEYKKELDAFRKQGFVRVRIDGTLHDLVGRDRDGAHREARHRRGGRPHRRARDGARAHRRVAGDRTATGRRPGARRRRSGPRGMALLGEERVREVRRLVPGDRAALLLVQQSPRRLPACAGIGTRDVFDPARVVPDPSRPLALAIEPWNAGRKPSRYYATLLEALASHFGVVGRHAFEKLPAAAREGILFGTTDEFGVHARSRRRTRRRSRNVAEGGDTGTA